MKVTISKADFEQAIAGLNFGADFALKQFGSVAGDGSLTIESAILARIESQYRPKPGQKPVNEATIRAMTVLPPTKAVLWKAPTDEQVAEWLKICEQCQFVAKLDGGILKCNHKDQRCPGCSQGKSGLAAALKTFSFRCPIKALKKS